MRAAGLRHKAASAGLHDCTPVDRQRLLGPCRRCRKLSELAWPCTGQQPNRYLLVASKDVPLVVIHTMMFFHGVPSCVLRCKARCGNMRCLPMD